VRGQTASGFPVIKYREAKKRFGDMIVLLAFGVFRSDLMEKIKAIAQENEFYAPEVPLFGGALFDRAFLETHRAEFDKVESMLSDEPSKEVFRSLLEYKTTGRIEPLIRCQSQKEEDFKALIPFRNGDIYVDLGAYDGDSVLEWHTLFPGHGKILALEPNHKSFLKLCANCSSVPFLEALEGAAWESEKKLSFNGKSGRSAAVDKSGVLTVSGYALDTICPKADMIKFDVEGAEREAIEGAKELIRSQAPTLCVSAYHKTEDLFRIPLQVKEIQPNYRVFLRHWPYIPAWDTVFFFVSR